MADFHFIRPLWLLGLIPLLPLCWAILQKQRRSENFEGIIDAHLLEHLLVGEQKKSQFRPIHLLFVTWCLAVFAAAGPAWQQEVSPFLADESGLMVLLKVSERMESEDVQPSRLERAKQKIADIIKARKDGGTGLIVYSGSAHLVMPVTSDDRVIVSMLEGISTETMPVQGDVLSAALRLGERIVTQSGLPGSLLVIGDSSAEQLDRKSSLPVQILAMQPAGRDPDPSLVRAAEMLAAPLIGQTLDSTDVESLVRRAETSYRSLVEPGQAERFKDGGYLLLPFLAAALLLWFRKGMVL